MIEIKYNLYTVEQINSVSNKNVDIYFNVHDACLE
jgi:hypothetical protein